MIRKIDHMDLAGKSTRQLIKRTFVPVVIALKNAGQYQTFKVKIPHQTHKVVGVIVTHTAPEQMMHHNRIYFGSAPGAAITESLICSLCQEVYPEGTEQCFTVRGKSGQKLYFALPKRLGEFYLLLDEEPDEFYSPVIVEIIDHRTGFKEDYYVWESQDSVSEEVSICLKKEDGDQDSGDPDEG